VLANDGYYNESRKMAKLFKQQMEVLEAAQEELKKALSNPELVKELEADIKNFESLQQEIEDAKNKAESEAPKKTPKKRRRRK
jgi:predicted patatin/cPLA2 family phospholipase